MIKTRTSSKDWYVIEIDFDYSLIDISSERGCTTKGNSKQYNSKEKSKLYLST